jgi:hypothetical protein
MGTATGLRISAVDGTAFLDNCPANILAAAGTGAQVKIYDSSNRYLLGYVGAVGSSEGLGDELITGWTNHAGYPFETFTSSGAGITQAVNTTGYGICYSNSFSTLGILLKSVINVTIASGSLYVFCLSTATTGQDVGDILTIFSVSGAYTNYKTIKLNNNYYSVYRNNTDGAVDFSATNSLKQVTAPSSSGVLILDAVGGNQNFVSKDANFTYNAASYTYEIISGNLRSKRFGGVPYAALNRGVF